MSETDAPKGDKKQKVKEPTTLGRRSTDGAWLTYARVIAYEPTEADIAAGRGERTYVTVVVGAYPDSASAGDAIIAAIEADATTALRRVFVPWGAKLDEVLSATGS